MIIYHLYDFNRTIAYFSAKLRERRGEHDA